MANQRHLELLAICHHAILQRYPETKKLDDLNRDKMFELAESNKYILDANPEAEHIYMEKVIVDYGDFLNSNQH